MKIHTLLMTDQCGIKKFYIDGRRVTRDKYDTIGRNADRRDTFYTLKKGDRWYHYSSATIL